MQTYLRFTRQEFEAIDRVCRRVELTEETFPGLQPFLVNSLRGLLPGLSERFIYFEDDHLLGRAVGIEDWLSADGRLRLWPSRDCTTRGAVSSFAQCAPTPIPLSWQR